MHSQETEAKTKSQHVKASQKQQKKPSVAPEYNQIINTVGPDLSIPEQSSGGNNTGNYQTHQQDYNNQAMGTIPWYYNEQHGGNTQWQQMGNHQSVIPLCGYCASHHGYYHCPFGYR